MNMLSFAVYSVIFHLAVCQNLVPLVNIKIAGKWMFIPLKMVLIGIDPYPFIPTKKRICFYPSSNGNQSAFQDLRYLELLMLVVGVAHHHHT